MSIFFRAILKQNKEGHDKNIRLELGVDEIKNYIQKNRLSWFGYVMQMEDASIPRKMLHTKMEGKDPKPDG